MARKILTPLQLEVMLRAYYSPSLVENADCGPQREAYKMLGAHDMLEVKHSSLVTVTEKGKVYIEHILSIPFPEAKWVIRSE